MKKFIKNLCLAGILATSFMFCGCNTPPVTPGEPTPPPTHWYGDKLGGGGIVAEEYIPTPRTSNFLDEIDKITTPTHSIDTTSIPTSAINITDTLQADGQKFCYLIDTPGEYYVEGNLFLSDGATANTPENIKIQQNCTIYFKNAHLATDFDVEIIKITKDVDANLVMVNDTENTFISTHYETKGISYRGDKSSTPEETATHTLSILGRGTMKITSSSDCINSKGGLFIDSTDLDLYSIRGKGLKANNLAINSATGTIHTVDSDVIQVEIQKFADLTEAPNLDIATFYQDGHAVVQNSTLSLTADGDGDCIQADSMIHLINNNMTFKTNGGAPEHINQISSDNAHGKGLKAGPIKIGPDKAEVVSDLYAICIESGTYEFNTHDDAINSRGDLYVLGGTFTVAAGDDSFHAEKLNLFRQKSQNIPILVNIDRCFEGLEGQYLEIYDGHFTINCVDDGLNAASNNLYQDDFDPTCYIYVDGGEFFIDALGDGIDGNGVVLLKGGKITALGPADRSPDAAMDSGGGILANGTEIFAVGSKQLVETPAQNSTQNVISYASNDIIPANTRLLFKNSAGDILLECTTTRSSQSIIISSQQIIGKHQLADSQPDNKATYTYTLEANDVVLATIEITTTLTILDSNGVKK